MNLTCIFLNFSTSEACKNFLGRPRHMFKVFTMFYDIRAFERTNFRDRMTCRSKLQADLRDIFIIFLLWTLLAQKLPDVTCLSNISLNMLLNNLFERPLALKLTAGKNTRFAWFIIFPRNFPCSVWMFLVRAHLRPSKGT